MRQAGVVPGITEAGLTQNDARAQPGLIGSAVRSGHQSQGDLRAHAGEPYTSRASAAGAVLLVQLSVSVDTGLGGAGPTRSALRPDRTPNSSLLLELADAALEQHEVGSARGRNGIGVS